MTTTSEILEELFQQKQAEMKAYTDTIKIIDGVVKLDRASMDKWTEDFKDMITLGRILNKRHGLFRIEWFD
jgi:hypothetical protein